MNIFVMHIRIIEPRLMSIAINIKFVEIRDHYLLKGQNKIHFSYDHLDLYDGDSTFAPKIGSFCNNSLPPTCYSGELI